VKKKRNKDATTRKGNKNSFRDLSHNKKEEKKMKGEVLFVVPLCGRDALEPPTCDVRPLCENVGKGKRGEVGHATYSKVSRARSL